MMNGLRLNKKLIVRSLVALVVTAVVVSVVLLLMNYLSWHDVTFNLSEGTKSITVYDDSTSSVVGSLDKSGTLRLREGSYYVVLSGDTVSEDVIDITINSTTKNIDINPYFSTEYLAEHFKGEIVSINTVIKDKYSAILGNWVVEDGTFYHFGDWYTGSMYQPPNEQGGGGDNYGIILKKVNGEWQIAATPRIIFRYADYKEIPTDIIDSVNQDINNFQQLTVDDW